MGRGKSKQGIFWDHPKRKEDDSSEKDPGGNIGNRRAPGEGVLSTSVDGAG